jgi:O-antigen ligase
MTLLTAVATFLQLPRRAEGLFQHRETKLYLAFYFMMILGVPFAMHRGVSFAHVITGYPTTVAYFLLFVTHVTSRQRFRQVCLILVAGAVIFSMVSLSQGEIWSGRFFTGSGMYDPNDVAYVELGLLPFALCILMGSTTRFRRLFGLMSVLLGMLVALFTGSRGGLIGILTFVALFMTLRIASVKGVYKGVLLVLLMGAVFLNVDKINVERYQTLTNLENDYNLEEGGRWDVWKKGLVILAGRPLTGVGSGNFGMAIGNYRRDEGELPKWQAAHSSFIQILVEVGLIGGILWIVLITETGRTFWRLRRRGPPGHDDLTVWAGVLFMGFVAQVVSSLFLSMGYSIYFTLFFAVAASLRQLASTHDGSDSSGLTPESRQRPSSWPSPALRARA